MLGGLMRELVLSWGVSGAVSCGCLGRISCADLGDGGFFTTRWAALAVGRMNDWLAGRPGRADLSLSRGASGRLVRMFEGIALLLSAAFLSEATSEMLTHPASTKLLLLLLLLGAAASASAPGSSDCAGSGIESSILLRSRAGLSLALPGEDAKGDSGKSSENLGSGETGSGVPGPNAETGVLASRTSAGIGEPGMSGEAPPSMRSSTGAVCA
mmetsp:Transcript_7865/g.22376  ORF Transcript_7865/g.22376 Transcript_7865/m.22376 type:complete len:213 (-) Transcript_7865:1475-2113(-)